MDTQNLNINTHLENLSTILMTMLTSWYDMFIGTIVLKGWISFQAVVG